ncbi:cobyrinate a,c-diamide synthase [Desulfolucanica intricata]|uniref:cobyrinate a,c-diamide synthase n=1 Tax=Desulfolucanica intricata TaxID=1285191 RepID=UPI00082DF7A4|nr:cobyrinate a,c-diamide synthase [Desulfolucanica intricata]
MYLPRLMFAGTNSGVGKTTITTAVMTALTRKGYKVQPYKVGPDYIDPGYHLAATGRISRNLDSWFLREDGITEIFMRSALDADIAIIEGVMGLYDGFGTGELGSSAQIAKLLKCPTVLILDVRSMARSAAAVVFGYRGFDPEVPIVGVILNRVGSDRHYRILKESIEANCGVPVLGAIKRNEQLVMPERHLGLVPTVEKNDLTERLEILSETISSAVDLDHILLLARQAQNLSKPKCKIFTHKKIPTKVRIGVMRDEAFNFYYQDGLDLLCASGAELEFISPIHDRTLPPDLDGLYLGGGFPEMFLEALAGQKTFLAGIRNAAARGMPIYAECGGFMYLTEAIEDFAGKRYPMAGVIPGYCRMERRRAALGYVEATFCQDTVLADRGTNVRGHEFHYSTYICSEKQVPAYRMIKSDGSIESYAGYVRGDILASYLHLHLAAYPKLASNFINNCLRFKEKLK